MNTVEPIRSLEKVEEIYRYLKNSGKKDADRDALLFLMGIYTGLRISDIRKFRVRDCYNKYYSIQELKTNKKKKYDWNPYLKRELDEYIKDKNPDDYLFKSRKGKNQPITRQRAYTIIKEACNACGVYNVGTHTLRKTFGWFLYKLSKKNIGMIMKILNHSSESMTLGYIGITQEENNNAMKKMKFF